MRIKHAVLLAAIVATTLSIGQGTSAPGALNIAQQPLFVRASLPPLNMLVMGKDHKIYYEAYNDASDLDGDGILDVGYRGWELKAAAPTDGSSPYKIDYYGYFNSYACYTWSGTYFAPQSHTADKTCSNAWSGDFLNYLTTSRMDALRRVLYGGWRHTDTDSLTILQGAFFPQDAHSWGKEYRSPERDGYDIASYAPLTAPTGNNYHLFAVTTTTDASAPLFRVMPNAPYRVWNWLSIEGPVAGNYCFNSTNQRVACSGTGAQAHPGHPGNRAAFNTIETNHAVPNYMFGSGTVDRINCNGNNCNPFGGEDNFLTIFEGEIQINAGRGGTYEFRIDGDDVIDFGLYNAATGATVVEFGCYNTSGRGFGGNCAPGSTTSGDVNLAAGTTYRFKFRHEEASGGEGYRLEWRRTGTSNQFGWAVLTTSAANANGNGSFVRDVSRTTYNLRPTVIGATGRQDYAVRVQACPGTASLREGDSSCRAYPNGGFKPTGILHDYGETQRMYFGLITGTQYNNLEGGVLRRNVSNFASEINAQTGQFRTDVNGIARTLDRLRMTGGGYNDGVTQNYANDTNWNWSNGTGNCPSIGDRALANGECRMWGNPIAEMLYESMRYFAGAAAGTARFQSAAGASQGITEENSMGLGSETWKDPYASMDDGGGGYPSCARPFQTVISDINPSYDGDLPGSAWATTDFNDGNPSTLSGFSAAAEGDAIWTQEFGGARNVFIGEVGNSTDGAPTAKSASSFGNIRGLAPEEPTKQGTYYSASVARYGLNHDINAAAGAQNIITYSIALASPLPRIQFPVAGSTITLLPYAKTISGTFGDGARKPTNTIVDFYVQRVANMPGMTVDSTINGGRPLAEFRINYEDVEQGNDHDMDAIVLYEIAETAQGKVQVRLTSEYAAGSANQNIGYVISGTTRDGIYLEVRDLDAPTHAYENRDGNHPTTNAAYRNGYRPYDFNTPPGVNPGGCINVDSTACGLLPTEATRTFDPGATTNSGEQLRDPLWYAAKFGGYRDGEHWDVDQDGDPDNYFLVTNPLNLRAQLARAFDRISNQGGDSGTVSVVGARVNGDSFMVMPSYFSVGDGHDWYGELTAYRVQPNGLRGGVLWNATSGLPDTAAGVAARKIYTSVGGPFTAASRQRVKEFRADQLGDTTAQQFQAVGYTTAEVTNLFGGQVTPNDLVNYLRGDQSKEGAALNVAPFRKRTEILGDIINSSPVVASKRADYGWTASADLPEDARLAYAEYVASKSASGRREYVFVGANDGMLHAFDGSDGSEVFAYIPNGVLGRTGLLADRDYGAGANGKRYYVDGQLTVGDAYADGWKTVLVGATGAGGRSVFGIDISNPASFTSEALLWEVNEQTDGDIGHVMGKPVIVPLEDGSWAAVFGNGYNSDNGDAALFLVDVFTGNVIKKIVAPDGNDVDANGLGYVTVLDTDGNGLGDTVYGGDLQGNMWRFDLSGAVANWGVAYNGTPVFVATDRDGERQPITGGVQAAVGPGLGYMVYFGTGRYFLVGDNSAATGQQVQSLYGVWDNGTAVSGGRAMLVGQEIIEEEEGARAISRNPVNYISHRGWYLDLVVGDQDTGERFISIPRLQSNRVLFDTYQPGITSDCQPGGQNWRYGLNLLTGGASLGQVKTPDGTAVGGGSTGAVATSEGAPNQGEPPVTLTGGSAGNLICDPTDPACEPPGQCTEVYPDPVKPLVVERACGRQSWRQLR